MFTTDRSIRRHIDNVKSFNCHDNHPASYIVALKVIASETISSALIKVAIIYIYVCHTHRSPITKIILQFDNEAITKSYT